MSEQLYQPGANALFLYDFTNKLIAGSVSRDEVVEAHNILSDSTPKDFISAVDLLAQKQPVSTKMKKGINKMLNVFYTHLNSLPQPVLKNGGFLETLVRDNKAIVEHTEVLKPDIKKAQVANGLPDQDFDRLKLNIKNLGKVEQHYQVMENILFPFLEKQWPDHRCFQVLWSVHDDVREGLRELDKMLYSEINDLKKFNRLTGDLFFNLRTVIFREEKILIPAIVEAGFDKALDDFLAEAAEIGWSFVESPVIEKSKSNLRNKSGKFGDNVKFSTGSLSPEQIELIFNHLPVDITFVDEDDTVRYFSTPKKRTFTRTNAVIGRTVQNCHPPESVWMVEEILEAFRKGDEDDASFWIPFKDQFVFIQYFAIRDSEGNYRGTIEVTQDVKEIRGLEGERRLLNWKKK
jgi:DUF438 domain-containing protein